MFNVTIDGNTIQVTEGTTILQAARTAGVKIPTLCDHPELTPYGGCRLCVVEVEGSRTLQPSCTLPVSNNMIVRTNTDKVREARKFVLTLIFSERNHFCPYCQVSGGDCELQNAAYAEGMTHWPLSPNYQPYAMDASHPFFILDNNRCILCRRCVRACGELVGNYTLGFEERGANSLLVADLGTPLGQSTCVSCGTCLQVCPTGALIDRQSAYRGRETQVEYHPTICTGCSLGCGLKLLTRDNHLVRIEGDWEAPLNEGLLCEIGRFLPIEEQHQRINTPLVRKPSSEGKKGALKAATWEEAFDAITAHIKPLADKGSKGIAAVASTRLPVEALSIFKQVFADHLHSDMVTSLEEGAFTATSRAVAEEVGQPFEATLDVLKKADCVITAGADLINNHEVASFFIKRTLQSGLKLVSIAPQGNTLDDQADMTLKASKGNDAVLLYGMAAAVLELGTAKGHAGFTPAEYDPDTVSKKTGIPAKAILDAVTLIAAAKNPVFIYGEGLTSAGSAALKALLELANLLGATVINLKGSANSLAASLLGLEKPFNLNGHQAAYVAVGDDAPSQGFIQRLQGIPFLAVQSAYVTPLTAEADVVLPVAIWTEQDGHFINFEGRTQESKAAITPISGVLTNEAVLAELATRLGAKVDADWHGQLAKVSPVALK